MLKAVHSNIDKPSSDSELITDQARITRLLGHLSKHYSPLTIQIKGHKQPYSSCIVDADGQYVLLDELIPRSGHEHLLEAHRITATGRLDGVEIRFSSTLEHVDEQKNMLTYHMKLPDRLEYLQRRLAYRVRIPMSKQLRVLIDNGDDVAVAGVLHDLSLGGAGKIIPDDRSNIKTGQYYECAIELPCRKWLYCTIEMRYIKNIPSRGKRLIGARFDELSGMQSRLIGRCIREMELEQIRKRAMYQD